MSGRLVAAMTITPVLRLEPVELDQELVEGLLPLVVAATETGTTMTADGVDLVDEDDCRGVALGLLEEVAHPGGANADEHLDEIGPGDREEGDSRLAGHRSGKQGLAGPRGAEEEDSLGDLGAHGAVLVGVLEEVFDLLQFLDRLGEPGHVVEGDLGLFFGDQLARALPNCITRFPPPCICMKMKIMNPRRNTQGRKLIRSSQKPAGSSSTSQLVPVLSRVAVSSGSKPST